MQSSEGLVKNEKSSRNLRYLLIVGVLIISFSLTFMIRMEPLGSGYQLDEFDPFFNYRATQFMIENGLPAYLEWEDDYQSEPFDNNFSANFPAVQVFIDGVEQEGGQLAAFGEDGIISAWDGDGAAYFPVPNFEKWIYELSVWSNQWQIFFWRRFSI